MVYIYYKVTPVKRTTTRKLQETNTVCRNIFKFNMQIWFDSSPVYLFYNKALSCIFGILFYEKSCITMEYFFYKSRNTKNRNRNISPFNVICFQIKLEPTPRFLLAQNSEYVAYLQAYTLLFSEQKQSCIMIDSTSKKTQFIIWSKYIFHVNYFICRGTQAFIVNNENMSEQKCLWPTTCIIKA